MSRLSQQELYVMNAIAHDELSPSNGETPYSHEDTGTYLDLKMFAWRSDISLASCRAIMKALVRKNVVKLFDNNEKRKMVKFTETGYDRFIKNCVQPYVVFP